MKMQYDDKYTVPPMLKKDDYVYIKLAKLGKPGYYLDYQIKLTFRKVGLYRIVRKISSLRYEIELPSWLKWFREIFIKHLVPVF